MLPSTVDPFYGAPVAVDHQDHVQNHDQPTVQSSCSLTNTELNHDLQDQTHESTISHTVSQTPYGSQSYEQLGSMKPFNDNQKPLEKSSIPQQEIEELQEELINQTNSIPSFLSRSTSAYPFNREENQASFELSNLGNSSSPSLLHTHCDSSPPTTEVNPNSATDVRIEIPEQSDPEVGEPIHPVLAIIEKQELGKHIMLIAIPMTMALVSSTLFCLTIERSVVAATLAFAFMAIWLGIVEQKTLLLILGIGLMLTSYYAILACVLPMELKWIAGVCLLLSLYPIAKVVRAVFRRGQA